MIDMNNDWPSDRATALTILENISDAFFALDREGRFVYINSQAESLLQRQRQDLLGQNVWHQFPDAVDSIFYQQYYKAIKELVNVEFEGFYPPLDTWFEVRAYPSENGLSVFFHHINQRHCLKQALRRSEARFRSLVAACSPAVWITDAQGQVAEDLPAWRMLTGQNEAEIKGWGWLEAIHPDDRLVATQRWSDAVTNQTEYKHEYRLRVADGNYRYFAVSGVPVLNEQEEIIEWVGTVRDISDRMIAEQSLRECEAKLNQLTEPKQAAATLQQNQERFRRAILYAPLPIMLYAEDGEVLQINLCWTELTGYTHTDIPTIEKWREKIESSGQIWQTDLEELYRLDRPVSQGEYIVTAANGERRTWQIYSTALGNLADGRNAIATMAIDISDRQKAELEPQKWASIVENSPDFIAVATLDNSVVFINAAGQQLVGLSAIEPGQTLPNSHFYTSQEWEYLQQQIRPILLERGRWEGETYLRHFQTEELIPVHQVVFLNIDRNTGQTLNIATVARDMRKYKQAEAQIRQLNATLEQRVEERTAQLETANQELEAFAYSIAHDLRAPVRGMHGLAEALLEDYGPQLDRMGQQYAQQIVQSGQYLETLIHDLLAYSRLSRIDLRLEPVNLEKVLSVAIDRVKADPDCSNIQITVNLPLPTAIGHFTTLIQIVTNLLSNAVKFVKDTEPEVKVWAESGDAWVKLWVSDNGIGIAREHQQRIWGVFERLHGVETYPGTGIGLAIVQKGVQRMGGTVGVESQLGQGSRFWICLRSAVCN